MKTHALIIRMHYEKDDPRFAWRLAYFKSMVLPRILNQTRKDFDIWIRCNPWHKEEIKSLSEWINTFTVKDEKARYKKVLNKEYFLDFVPWGDVEGMPKYDIQSGLDSDDLIGPRYMETIKYLIENYSGKSLHISFQPELFDTRTLKCKAIPQKYTSTKGSAFMSLYQTDKEDYHFIYERSHLKLGELAERSVVIPQGHAWASVHEFNESTGI